MGLKSNWRNKTSLREKISLINLFDKTPMEVADPIACINCFPPTPAENESEQK